MRVLFCVRHNFHSAPGGAQIQIMKTKQYLEEIGVQSDLVTDPENADFSNYDIVHLTDLTWVYDLFGYIEKLEKVNYQGKVVLSTIYWPFDDYAKNGAPPLQSLFYTLFGINGFERAKALAKLLMRRESVYLKGVFNSYITSQREIVESVDLLLPNSEMEAQALFNRLDVDKPYSVVNNAIDTDVFEFIKEDTKEEVRQDLVTFVARIDSRKNQIGFLESIMHTDFKVLFIGNPGPNSQKYYERLKKLAEKRGNVEFLSHLDQSEVFRHMTKAKVNVLTSWIETPGLVSLEAAYAGCNIVVSDKGSVREYFKDYAFYCDPADSHSMKEAVLKAIQAPYDPGISEMIENEYSWRKAAQQTLSAYQKLLC
ncbi:glycosyltransferase [Vreelandella rituensis]